jgi:hypothetical protein
MKSLFLFYAVVVIGMITGWVLNVIAIVHTMHGPLTAELAIRIVGIFVVPLGGVMGFVS